MASKVKRTSGPRRMIHGFDDDGRPVAVPMPPPPKPGNIDPRIMRAAVKVVRAEHLESEGRAIEADRLRAEAAELRAEAGW